MEPTIWGTPRARQALPHPERLKDRVDLLAGAHAAQVLFEGDGERAEVGEDHVAHFAVEQSVTCSTIFFFCRQKVCASKFFELPPAHASLQPARESPACCRAQRRLQARNSLVPAAAEGIGGALGELVGRALEGCKRFGRTSSS